MEGFQSAFPPPLGLCGAPAAPAAPAAPLRWAKREARFVTPYGLSYLELCRAAFAQAQAGAGAASAPPTRDCGVQVNARVDKPVQCSLGPKTLLGQEDGDRSPCETAQQEEEEQQEHKVKVQEVKKQHSGSTAPPGGRLLLLLSRPPSVYSRLFHRGEPKSREEGAEHLDGEKRQSPLPATHKASNLQFLEQKYGFFHCKKCNIRWESAFVWCIPGTNKVYYKQLCRKCQVGFNPYRVESIVCKGCSETCCVCEKKQRHINMTRPHRQDLCCRCRGTKISCDATYSFKYVF
ncbi:zygote arrest protein 1.S-like [Stigmatopora argus]